MQDQTAAHPTAGAGQQTTPFRRRTLSNTADPDGFLFVATGSSAA